jgi:hypothetical protein
MELMPFWKEDGAFTQSSGETLLKGIISKTETQAIT